MKRLPRMSSGGVLTPQSWDMVASVIDANFRECQLQPGKGVTISNGPGGQSVSVNLSPVQSANAASINPWDIFITPTGTGSGATVKFQPGTISGALPSNMFSSFSCNLIPTYYLMAACSSSDGSTINSSTLSFLQTSPSTPPASTASSAPSSFSFPLGVLVAGTFYNLYSRSVIVSSKEVLRTDKTEPSALELPYTSYWNWVVT